MNGLEWRLIQRYFHMVPASLSIILNIFLILLISKRSPKTMRSYKHMLMGVAVFEIFYSSIEIFVSPIVHSVHTVVLVLSVFEDCSKDLMLVLISTYCASFGCFLAMFGVLFAYRYYVAIGSSKLRYFESWYLTIWVAIVLVCGGTWGVIGYFMYGPSEELDEFIRTKLYDELALHPENITYIAPHFYFFDEHGDKIWNWKSMNGMNGVCFIITITVFFIMHFGIKNYRFIKSFSKNTALSEKAKTMQKQFFYALVIQACIPFVLLQLPLTIMFVCAFLNFHLGQLAGIDTFTISLFPVLDPLPTIFVVRTYRAAVLGCFTRCRVAPVSPKTSQIPHVSII